MISSDDVKEALSIELLRVFRNVKIYKEAVSEPLYPHFFIYQVNLKDTEDRKNYHIFSYLMEIRYRVASDPSTVVNLQSELDEASLKLLENFNTIKYNNDLIRCKNKSIEKVDGVLHFMLNCDILVKEKIEDSSPKFDKLQIAVEVK